MAKHFGKPEERQRLAQIAAACRYDPLLWAETAWEWGKDDLKGKDIREWQADILDEIATHLANPETRHKPLKIAVASGHGIGKSAAMGMVGNWAMSCHPGARCVVTANTEGQLRTKTSPEIAKWFSTSISAPAFDIDTMGIRTRQDDKDMAWVMDFVPWSEHNSEAFAGLHNEGRIIVLLMDEASAIPPKIWEVAEGALTDENTIIIWIAFGNPTNSKGEFRECFRRNRKEWVTRQIDSRDVEGTNRDYLQGIVDKYGENSDRAKVRVRGMFPTTSTRQMIPTPVIDEAYGRHYARSAYEFAPTIITCDPAWTGDDDLVIAKRQGLAFEILDVIPKNDNDIFIATKIARYEDKFEAEAVFIDLGYGTGIASAGRTWGRNWELIPFGAKAPEPGFADMRAFMFESLQAWMEEGGAIPADAELYEELISIETLPDNNGIVRLKSKEQMKKDGDQSPNRADALAMTFARPVAPKRRPLDEAYRSVMRQGQNMYLDQDGDYVPR